MTENERPSGPQTTINSLPAELILQITSWLPLRDVSSLHRTNHHFAGVVTIHLRSCIARDITTSTDRHALEFHLLRAACRGYHSVLTWIIESHLSVDTHQQFLVNALCLAAKCGDTKSVQLLLPHVVDVNAVRQSYVWCRFYPSSSCSGVPPHSNALCEAALGGHEHVVRLLLTRPDIDVEATEGKEYHPDGMDSDIFIVDKKAYEMASLNVLSRQTGFYDDETPLENLEQRAHLQDLTADFRELSSPEIFNTRCFFYRMTPLARAVKTGSVEVVSALLAHGADVYGGGARYYHEHETPWSTDYWRSPLRQALEVGVPSTVKKLLRDTARSSSTPPTHDTSDLKTYRPLLYKMFVSYPKSHTETIMLRTVC